MGRLVGRPGGHHVHPPSVPPRAERAPMKWPKWERYPKNDNSKVGTSYRCVMFITLRRWATGLFMLHLKIQGFSYASVD